MVWSNPPHFNSDKKNIQESCSCFISNYVQQFQLQSETFSRYSLNFTPCKRTGQNPINYLFNYRTNSMQNPLLNTLRYEENSYFNSSYRMLTCLSSYSPSFSYSIGNLGLDYNVKNPETKFKLQDSDQLKYYNQTFCSLYPSFPKDNPHREGKRIQVQNKCSLYAPNTSSLMQSTLLSTHVSLKFERNKCQRYSLIYCFCFPSFLLENACIIPNNSRCLNKILI